MKFSEKYLNYIQSDAWKDKAAQRRKIDGNKCALCGSKRKLQVHHLTYESLTNEDVEKDLITLCQDCHNKAHEIKDDTIIGIGLGILIDSEKNASGLLEYFGITESYCHQIFLENILQHQEILYISPRCLRGSFTIPHISPSRNGFSVKDCEKIKEYFEKERPHIWNVSRKFYKIALEEETESWIEERDFLQSKKGVNNG